MNDQIHEIEITIEQAREKIARGEALDRLYKNKDFLDLVGNGYIQDEAIRLCHLRGAPHMQNEQRQQNILRDIDGVASLVAYFHRLAGEAREAEQLIKSSEVELELMYEEEVAEA